MERVFTGIVFGSVWLAILFLNSFSVLWIIVSLVGCIALHEFFTICFNTNEKKLHHLALITSSIPLFAAYFKSPDIIIAFFFISILLFTLIVIFNYSQIDSPFILISKYCCGVTYISFCAAHTSLIMAIEGGVFWVALLTIITVSSDTGAFYAGTKYGKNKLCPAISPGKTKEGFWGGALFCVIITSASGYWLLPEIPLFKIAILAFFLSCLGVIGDLTESIMKRANSVKDSGKILPGHGGILDRIDSLLATTPALFYAIHLGII